MRSKIRVSAYVYFLTIALVIGFVSLSASTPKQSPTLRFELSFPTSVHEKAGENHASRLGHG